jgi:putative heme iron utilization protein
MADDVLRPVDDAARSLAKRLLRSASQAALASLEPQTGWPYASLVTVATALDGTPLLLVSGLSLHTRALAGDGRCSLLLAGHAPGPLPASPAPGPLLTNPGPGDPLAHPRLSVFGRARFLGRDTQERGRARQRFLSRHPKAALYADFRDFDFARIEPERGLLNAGFGRAHELTAADFTSPLDAALLPLLDLEAAALAHMNADHPDAVRLIATRLCGGVDGDWQMVGLDPDGLDLALDGSHLRYTFAQPLRDASELRTCLVELARQARATAPSRHGA